MPKTKEQTALTTARNWYESRGWEAFAFQEEMIERFFQGWSGILNAPTGSGKTFAMWIPILMHAQAQKKVQPGGLRALWITPLRALAKDIVHATQGACDDLTPGWRVEARTGDTSSSRRKRQKEKMPEGLVITPESLQVLFASKDHQKWFEDLEVIVVDEWHELMGTKRGTQIELAIAHLRQIRPELRVWGISATIGNLEQALEVLLGPEGLKKPHGLVRALLPKDIEVTSILPDTVEKFPWAGHLGINMVDKVLPYLKESRSTLIFTNTRSQCEIWYQSLLAADPELAGVMAMHHGSIDAELRSWVEEALHDGRLKVVVCTSSLDLGVDFRPVETVFQVGGPKGVARFVQRAGRSGHGPGEKSRIFFVPTHSLELVEAAALRKAVAQGLVENRPPIERPWDVLLQYMVTLAVGDGLNAEATFNEVRQTWAYRDLTKKTWKWLLDFLVTGGNSLGAYDEYHKLVLEEDGRYRVPNKRLALQHRMSIGTIVSETSITVKYLRGGRIGTVEESFISQLKPGDTFWFAGRSLELVRVRNLEALVKRSKSKKGKVPRWMGARMSFSSKMARELRNELDNWLTRQNPSIEIEKLEPMLALQQDWSLVPPADACLIEYIESREGHHLFVYPFEGRVVHEIMGALMAWRISQLVPISFSIAMNDYGFELLADQEIPLEEALENGLFSSEGLAEDLQHSINETEMAARRFWEIASVAGLIFKGIPGRGMPAKHLRATSSLIFKVFQEYDPHNLLLQQAYDEVLAYQIDASRLKEALDRLNGKHLLVTRPHRFTPFCFPIMVDRLRERLSSEKLLDRIVKMQVQLERQAGR